MEGGGKGGRERKDVCDGGERREMGDAQMGGGIREEGRCTYMPLKRPNCDRKNWGCQICNKFFYIWPR
jgi:hypothetical protein